MQPTLERLQSGGWNVQTVDIEARPDLTNQFRIQNLPTLVILGPRGEIDRIVGVADANVVQRRIDRAAARYATSSSNGAPARSAQPQQPSGPIVRGQSPGVARNLSGAVQLASAMQAASAPAASQVQELTPAQAVARAAAATVRIRVDEGNTTAHGTGTIVDVHGEEALVLTCGHLFRDMQSGSVLSIDLFAGTPNEINLPSQLIDFKADDEDIGLITFRLPVPIEPVPLLPHGTSLDIGQTVFSFGCDHGQNPTRHDTRITNINRYIGPENIEIAGAPAVGRSGGGLFDLQGRLIGVCNAADTNDNEGIYASANVIYDQINRLGLQHLFEGSQPSPSPQTAAGNSGAGLLAAGHSQQPAAILGSSEAKSQSAQQVICIIKGGDGKDKVLTIQSPTSQLLQQIQSAAQ